MSTLGDVYGDDRPADPHERDALVEVREWFRQWHIAWEALAECGSCDELGSVEYSRLTAEARFQQVVPSQVTMRAWIQSQANVRPAGSITEASLARRQARQRKEEIR